MNTRQLVLTAIALAVTAASVAVAARAIVGTAAAVRTSAMAAEAAPGEIEIAGNEVAELLAELSEPYGPALADGDLRDPTVPYSAPRKSSPPKRRAAPKKPVYRVAAVIIDEDPTAIVLVDGRAIAVRVGDELDGGRVTAIEAHGITVEGESGMKKYPYSPSE